MELRQLEYLTAVARHGQFTRASRELRVAQPAVSQQIRKLEAELGLELLNRGGGRVEPTEAGELLIARAHRALAELEAANQELDEVRGLLRGRVDIGALPVSRLDIASLLIGFRELHPEVGIHLHEQSIAVILPMLRRDEIDLCFGLTEPGDHGDDIDGRLLFRERLLAAVAPTHPFAKRKSIRLEEIADEPLIRFRTGSALQRAIDAEFDRAGATASWSFESFELETVRSLASRGVGIALMPEGYLDRVGTPVVGVPLRPGVKLPVSILWRAERRRPPAAQAFLDFALERLGAKPGPAS